MLPHLPWNYEVANRLCNNGFDSKIYQFILFEHRDYEGKNAKWSTRHKAQQTLCALNTITKMFQGGMRMGPSLDKKNPGWTRRNHPPPPSTWNASDISMDGYQPAHITHSKPKDKPHTPSSIRAIDLSKGLSKLPQGDDAGDLTRFYAWAQHLFDTTHEVVMFPRDLARYKQQSHWMPTQAHSDPEVLRRWTAEYKEVVKGSRRGRSSRREQQDEEAVDDMDVIEDNHDSMKLTIEGYENSAHSDLAYGMGNIRMMPSGYGSYTPPAAGLQYEPAGDGRIAMSGDLDIPTFDLNYPEGQQSLDFVQQQINDPTGNINFTQRQLVQPQQLSRQEFTPERFSQQLSSENLQPNPIEPQWSPDCNFMDFHVQNQAEFHNGESQNDAHLYQNTSHPIDLQSFRGDYWFNSPFGQVENLLFNQSNDLLNPVQFAGFLETSHLIDFDQDKGLLPRKEWCKIHLAFDQCHEGEAETDIDGNCEPETFPSLDTGNMYDFDGVTSGRNMFHYPGSFPNLATDNSSTLVNNEWNVGSAYTQNLQGSGSGFGQTPPKFEYFSP